MIKIKNNIGNNKNKNIIILEEENELLKKIKKICIIL